MKATCGNCACSQGRSCPVTTVRLPTRRRRVSRLMDHWFIGLIVYVVPIIAFLAVNWEKF